MNPFMTGKLFHDSLIQFERQFFVLLFIFCALFVATAGSVFMYSNILLGFIHKMVVWMMFNESLNAHVNGYGKMKVTSFRLPRCPILKTLPATLLRPKPKLKLYLFHPLLTISALSMYGGTRTAVTVSLNHSSF